MQKTKILIIEDEAPIRQLLRVALEPAQYEVMEAENTELAHKKIAQRRPDLILVDWMLPGTSGVNFTRHLKSEESTRNIPIIMLTARAEESNKLQGFEAGVDDYITKPFSPRELLARIKSVLRRGILVSTDNIIQIDALELNTQTHEVHIHKQLITLTPTEYRLLHFFMKHPNKVYTRAQLLDHVWSNDTDINDRSIDALVRRLRKRLKPHDYDSIIQTTRGAGYQLTLPKHHEKN